MKNKRDNLKRKKLNSQVWRVKPGSDEKQDLGSSAAPINMVLMLPTEFTAPTDEDEDFELDEAMAQLAGT